MELGRGWSRVRLAAVEGNKDSWPAVVKGWEGCLDGELGRARLAAVKDITELLPGLEGGLPLQRWQGGLLDCLPAH